jgi:hypothetical protein
LVAISSAIELLQEFISGNLRVCFTV